MSGKVIKRRLAVALLVFMVHQVHASSSDTTATNTVTIDIEELSENNFIATKWNNLPIFVIKRSNKDLRNLRLLSKYTFNTKDDGENRTNKLDYFRSVAPDIFVVTMVSPYTKCKVDYVPVGDSEIFRGEEWLGGFHSPCHGEVFDVAGRPLKPSRYNPTNFPLEVPPLPIPPYKIVDRNTLIIGDSATKPKTDALY